MCLTVRGNIKIARKDRVVYKTLNDYNGELSSPLRGMRYIPGKTYKRKAIKIVIIHPYIDKNINEGYHAYTTLSKAKKKCRFNHSNTIYRAIIPAGSQYAISKDHEIVSNQIMIKAKVFKTLKSI